MYSHEISFMKYFKLTLFYTALFMSGIAHAGEIVISAQGQQNMNSASNAGDNRIKAQTYIQPSTQSTTTIIVVPADGMLSPPSVGRPPDNRNKARNYTKENSYSNSDPTIIWLENSQKNGEPSRANLERNLNKARAYSDISISTTIQPGTYIRYGTAVGLVSGDGVIVFNCEQISNTAGRIGNDTQSGDLFMVSLNNKLHQARCK